MSSLKTAAHTPLTEFLVNNLFFGKDPFIIVDVGTLGGYQSFCYKLKNQAQLIGFEPNKSECQRLNKKNLPFKHRCYPIALSSKNGAKKFVLYKNLAASSFYLPDTSFLKRFNEIVNFKKSSVKQIPTHTLDSFLKRINIQQIDFIKLDIEGSELDVFKGGKNILTKGVLGLTFEVSFNPFFKHQPTFSETDLFLKKLGFKLYDINLIRFTRKNFVSSSRFPGQIISGHALYFRDPIEEFQKNKKAGNIWSINKILKLAVLMEVYNLNDCALELVDFISKTIGTVNKQGLANITNLDLKSLRNIISKNSGLSKKIIHQLLAKLNRFAKIKLAKNQRNRIT